MRNPYGYDGYGDEWDGYVRSVPAEYSSVQIEDEIHPANVDVLLHKEIFISYEELINPPVRTYPSYSTSGSSIYAQPSLGYTPSLMRNDSPIKPKFLSPEKDSTLNPPNETVICSDNPFSLNFLSKVCPSESTSWLYFASQGVEMFDLGNKFRETTSTCDKRVFIQRYRVGLRHGVDLGCVQFFQDARFGSFNTIGDYPYGYILTLYVLRRQLSQASDFIFPPMVTLMPHTQQTFVVLRQKQLLQLRVPSTYTVETSHLASGEVKLIGRHHAAVGDCDCYHYKVFQDRSDSYPIFFAGKDVARRGGVLIPPIEVIDGSRYAVIHSPMNNLSILPGGVDGLIFRRMECEWNRGAGTWLDQQHKLRVESSYCVTEKSLGGQALHAIFDMRVKIMDKSLQQFDIINLFDNAQVKTA